MNDEPVTIGRIETRSEVFGVGALVECVGLVIVFLFPIDFGVIIGALVFAVGFKMARYSACSVCGNKLSSSKVKICPHCHAILQ
jgi:hypothetical protein